jgi:predicted Rossmann fold nucleotide-binding protein DprA/Smf involved in DNA uptake
VEAGATVAVTGGGVDVVYPKAHRQLHREIVDRDAVVSEMPPGTALWKWSFPARNRLIAAISDLVVVVQGARHSGSLHTADAALARNIPVAAVPGRIDAGVSQGSNLLLADGALVVTEPSVVVRALGLDPDDKKAAIKAELVEACEAISADRVDDYLLQVGTQVGNTRLARLELLGLAETGTDGRWRLVG